MILAVDPGPEKSGWALLAGDELRSCGHDTNEGLVNSFHEWGKEVHHDFACEWIESMGMAVGATTFETVYWTGRMDAEIRNMQRVTRREVKLNLCGSMQAKDANVRRAVLDRFPATGGGAEPVIGTKGQPGPLYTVRGQGGHVWSALAVALTFRDRQEAQHAGLKWHV